MRFGKGNWKTFSQGIEREWLLTNGIGGFASSTIIGANTRRYHGLLIASLNPPVQRHLILSKIDESISIEGRLYNLYSFKTPDFTMRGYKHLDRFELNPLPEYFYSVEDVFINKKICMVHGENTVVVVYRIVNGSSKISLKLTPLINFRDHHQDSCSEHMVFAGHSYGEGVLINPYNLDLNINIYCSEGLFTKAENSWFNNMYYPVEAERGLHAIEDHFIPGSFEVVVDPGEHKVITFIATIEDKMKERDGLSIIKKEEDRIESLKRKSGYRDPLVLDLVKAADDFIVYRKSTDAATIIAGYPWFTDWGRDTMIALPGLTLITKRFNDAKLILYTFSKYVRNGLIPNTFPDAGQEPYYNTVDAALWYFEAVNKYLEYTEDYSFVESSLYDSLQEIINSYKKGTLFNIKMDEDFLITAGDRDTQLTWMDAKVDNWVVTPRQGKAVEINALWYNALKVMVKLGKAFDKDISEYQSLCSKVKYSFEKNFWNREKQCLYDVISDEFKDESVRPNQILAVSLSYPIIEGEKAKKVVEKVWKELYTAYGLRSLSPRSKEYRGIYIGDRYSRDGSYHQGTVWTWPLGHFIVAYVRVNEDSEESKKVAARFIDPFKDHLEDACVGSISEIFDGDQPLIPRGCFAQAWSVGEILRACVETGCFK